MSFLDKILPSKKAEVAALRAAFAKSKPPRPNGLPIRDFEAALAGGNRLITEIKRKSPSHPEFHQAASPATLARAYFRNGAAALSIVTDKNHFGTSLADVAEVKAAVPLPVLVKDFVIDDVQLFAAWVAGADAVLLIVRMLEEEQLNTLFEYAHGLGLHVLVECHDVADIQLAVNAEARLIGVNNRNLATLTTDLKHGAALMPHVPQPAIRISESGLYLREDITNMAEFGADAFLVGHALLQSRDPGRKVAELVGRESEKTTRVKICGITSVEDALQARNSGADILGLIFANGVRQVSEEQALEIRQAVPDIRICGVFLNQSCAHITSVANSCDLDLIQLHGDENPQQCDEIAAATGRPLIKALTPDQATVQEVAPYKSVAYFLVDLPKGASKNQFTPAQCREAAMALMESGHEVFLAGGLTPGNVRVANNEVQPFAIDVASGVEAEPRIKDPNKTQLFIMEVKR